MKLLVSLCPACHAKIHHTRVVFSEMPPFLLELWREQHPEGHEQTRLEFRDRRAPAVPSSTGCPVRSWRQGYLALMDIWIITYHPHRDAKQPVPAGVIAKKGTDAGGKTTD